MVKIVNRFGDIKQGKQGEAVFQLHYGQQMRRIRKPKTGQTSKPQTARRLLFTQALLWRKTLTRHDRVYLEGVAYHRRLVDSEGVTLTWDRLALKIALEVPTVAVVE